MCRSSPLFLFGFTAAPVEVHDSAVDKKKMAQPQDNSFIDTLLQEGHTAPAVDDGIDYLRSIGIQDVAGGGDSGSQNQPTSFIDNLLTIPEPSGPSFIDSFLDEEKARFLKTLEPVHPEPYPKIYPCFLDKLPERPTKTQGVAVETTRETSNETVAPTETTTAVPDTPEEVSKKPTKTAEDAPSPVSEVPDAVVETPQTFRTPAPVPKRRKRFTPPETDVVEDAEDAEDAVSAAKRAKRAP